MDAITTPAASTSTGTGSGTKVLIALLLVGAVTGAIIWGRKTPAIPGGDDGSGSKGGGTTGGGKGSTYTPGASTPSKSSSSSSSASTPSGFPLNVGSNNSLVGDIQTGLNQSINAGLTVDNNFGPLTLAAVKKAGYNVPIGQTTYNAIKSGQTLTGLMASLNNAIGGIGNIFADGRQAGQQPENLQAGVFTYHKAPITMLPFSSFPASGAKEYGVKVNFDA